jgi:hypothetical protein
MDLLGENWSSGISIQSIWRQFVPNVAQKLFWKHPMILLCDEPQVDARFGLSCVKRIIGSKIILEAPDGTPR